MSENKNMLTFDNINHVVRGFTISIAFSKKNVEDALDYRPHDGDIVLASYPKAGSTWMQYTILQILSKGKLFPSFEEATFKKFPFMEMAGTNAIDAMPPPRMYKHHLPYDRIPKNPQARMIFCYRHPEDVLVSFFHFTAALHPDVDMPFDLYFEAFLVGDVSCGCYFSYVKSYLACADDHNLLLVSYEKVKANCRDEILRIAEFLGPEYKTQLLDNPDVLHKVLLHTSFDYMKKNLDFDNPLDDKHKMPMFRKGKVGDGKNLLSRQQMERLKAKAHEVMGNHTVLAEWYGK